MEIGHSRRNRFLAFALGAGVLIVMTGAPRAGAADYQPKVLCSFCSQSNCTDGSSPHAGLIMDTAGNLYGTTLVGGANRPSGTDGGGTVFELTPNAAKTKWTETVLYSFCSQGGKSCTDGASPEAGLIIDKAGNFYSTASYGGADNGGTVFELTPDAAKTTWTESVLYRFCNPFARGGTSCPDGALGDGYAGLIMDKFGNLYGTTITGGNDAPAACTKNYPGAGCGVVFELMPNMGKTKWRETVPYRFCSKIGCTDGRMSEDGLIMDKAGNLYGVTSGGGNSSSAGVVFELTPQITGVPWKETVLYSFCSQPNCTSGDPYSINGSLIMDAEGNLYGTTELGGNDSNNPDGGGVVFELTPNAAKTKWVETVLYNFCSQGGSSCTDGREPSTGLIMDKFGNLYGATITGGADGSGTVFELTHNATKTKWIETVLYSFCCTRPAGPSGLIMDKAGNLYGTTSYDGANGSGEVFELVKSPSTDQTLGN
jgi:uncharacterized repeat protein (TIGR03803 family)